ncbi:tol-pal system protein YbgF [Variovorax sp.]|uniref:tol-pal system protein YbgF n=1 Tax=Variovorax sp. TaxID=1871043 RepID=UPI002D41F759|nr:tol-pal system protein YbgF [Variovorax sp.]HYP86226.1 tol-pal system protein YbgF [Variovorax sp.]
MKPRLAWRQLVLAVALVSATAGARAALFEDDEARRAILDLRERVETMRQRSSEETEQLRRSLLDLQTQIEAMRGEMQRMTGKNEELTKQLSDLQSRQAEAAKANGPAQVNVDGREFTADPREKADFDAALGIFRAGQFAQAQTSFAEFVKRYPQSGYNPSALFWLGNAQYATRNYTEAIANFRSMLSLAPDHAKAPEAVLSIANCQIELKDTKGARRTLEDLAKAYPNSEAAQAGKERLARLK